MRSLFFLFFQSSFFLKAFLQIFSTLLLLSCRHLVAPASSDEEELSADNKAKVLLEAAITKNKGEQDKLEVTWEQGLQPSSLQPQKSSGSKEPTHWEKYLEKRRLKRKVGSQRLCNQFWF